MRFNLAPLLPRTRTLNRAGGEAFVVDDRFALASLVLTSFVQDQFYRSATGAMDETRRLIAALPDKRFAAQTALYARDRFGLRSISHVVAVEIARHVKGEPWTKSFFDRLVVRVDDVTETLALYLATYGRPIPNSLKKGLGAALARFDAYQLAKYRAEGKAVSLVDAVNLLHPPHTDALAALVNGTLAPADTWETRLSAAGQVETEADGDRADAVAEAKAEAWAELVRTGRIGAFALLRNLRNIAAQAPEVLDEALALLVDERRIRSSRILPFRYATAMEEIGKTGDGRSRAVREALAKALDLSVANVPELPGRTLVVLDDSGSMMGRPIRIASLFAAVLAKRSGADLMRFSDDAAYVPYLAAEPTATLMQRLADGARMGGTNFHAPLVLATRTGAAYDRIVFLSDMQGWIGHNAPTATLAAYEKATGTRPFVYSFDVAGYGSLQLPQDRIFCLAGVSEKVFDTMSLLEEDRHALVNAISSLPL